MQAFSFIFFFYFLSQAVASLPRQKLEIDLFMSMFLGGEGRAWFTHYRRTPIPSYVFWSLEGGKR